MPARPTIAQRLAESLRRQIAAGIYKPGEKLPSIRETVAMHGYSKNAVVDAYERLVASGDIEPRRGAGYYVMDTKWRAPTADTRNLSRAIDTVWLLREQTNNDPSHLAIGHGIPPSEWFDDHRLDKYVHKVLRTGLGKMFQYGSSYGYLPLRQMLARRLSGFGIEADVPNIVTTHGANHAHDLIIRSLVQPGEPVLIDEPGYYPLYGKLQLQRAQLHGIRRQADGPDIAMLEHKLRTTGARIFFTQSVGQNPTGSDTTSAKAFRILKLAEQYDALVIESDPLADLKPATLTRITALDQLQRTIYVGSFTKTVSAALRVGFIACDPSLADRLAHVKLLLQVSTSEFAERTLDAILRDKAYTRHVNRLRQRMETTTATAADLLRRAGAELFVQPEHSLYLWAALPHEPDSMDYARRMLTRGIAIAPGAVFHLDPGATVGWCRYNTGYVGHPRFRQALRQG